MDISQPPTHGLEGERRVVTILFCDVQGSTAMAEHLDPEEWAEIMNTAFGYLTRPVLRYEGTVARLMGDGILAFFGAPVAHEDDPVRAVLAGLDIVDGIQAFRKQIAREFDLDFNVRVGINTGPVVVGAVGTALAGEYTAMGDAANLAARMEQTAQPGTIQIGEHTYQLVHPYFECEALDSLELKNREELVQRYRVLRPREIPGRARGISGLESPLVGRDAEFALLDRALADLLTQGRGQIVSLIGEAGLGKSRLVEELQRQARLAGFPPTSWIESRGISYDMTRPYGMFVQQLRQIHAVGSEDSPQIAQQKVTDFFSHLAPDQLEAFFLVADLLLEQRAGPDGNGSQEGEAVKRKIFAASLDLWARLAAHNPLVLVFDDLHWADPASIDLILHLFQLVDQAPILFLCAFRPYRRSHGWQVKTSAETDFPHRYAEIALRPLDDANSGRLVDNLLAIADLPPHLQERMLRKAEGNPFFLEELVRTLIDHGLVQRDPSGLRWQASGESLEIGIPDNLQAMLLARIDRLNPDSRRTLQQAAVIGRTFQKQVLQAIAGQSDRLDQQLVDLQRAELIHEAARLPEPEYMFHHELIRDAAYQSILKRQRRDYHRQAAQAIEAFYPERLTQEANRLAYHYAQAQDELQALHYYTLAGDTAARLFANREACDDYEQAIHFARRLDSPAEQLVSLYTRRGRALELLNDYDKALKNYTDLEKIGEERNDLSLVLAALIPQATIYSTLTSFHNPVLGKQLSQKALELAIQLGDHRSEARTQWNLMLANIFANFNLPQALIHGSLALAIAREHGLREELAFILHDIARPYMGVGRWDEARAATQEAEQLFRELGNKPMLADNLSLKAEGLYITGNFPQALEAAAEALRISLEIGSIWGQAYSQYIPVPTYFEMGEIDRSLEAYQAAYQLAIQANFAAGMLGPPAILSWLFIQLGDEERAREFSRLTEQAIDRYPTFEMMRGLSNLFQELYFGDAQKAYQQIGNLLKSDLDAISEIFFGPLIYLLQVDVLLGVKKYQQALEQADKFLEQMRSTGSGLAQPDMFHARAHALLGLNRKEEALQALLEARDIARRQISRRSLWPVLADLARLAPDPKAAMAYHQEGREVVEFIAGHISDKRLRGKFLSMPEVQELLAG